MPRYIDADELYEIVTKKYSDIVAGSYPYNIVAYDMARLVKNAPTADVVPKAEFDALDDECSRLERLEEEYHFSRPKAIQEMVERLKKRLPAISPCIFDNIAKEVLEEQQDG